MRSVKHRHTGPELVVRSFLHRMGARFRLHAAELPGKPDVVFRPNRVAIFVHGCFWHGHRCRHGRLPKSNLPFWSRKLEKNKERDRRVQRELRLLGWTTFTIWQCETKHPIRLQAKLEKIMDRLRAN